MKMKEDPEMPVFRKKSGLCMTGAEKNRKLDILTKEVGKLVPGGVIKSHSFEVESHQRWQGMGRMLKQSRQSGDGVETLTRFTASFH